MEKKRNDHLKEKRCVSCNEIFYCPAECNLEEVIGNICSCLKCDLSHFILKNYRYLKSLEKCVDRFIELNPPCQIDKDKSMKLAMRIKLEMEQRDVK